MINVIKNWDRPFLSVIVPVFNEIENIRKFHSEMISSLSLVDVNCEIIYVDDNSNDGTFEWINNNTGHVVSRVKNLRAEGFEYKKGEQKIDVFVLRKNGNRGKSYSFFEGFNFCRGRAIVMIDGDLQYPPSEIASMLSLLNSADVVVSERKFVSVGLMRKVLSKTFKNVFGKFIFGLDCDIQSGLKLFKREVLESVKFQPSSKWAFDLELLHKARIAGFSIVKHDIEFVERNSGSSKINIFKTILEIGGNALRLKFSPNKPILLRPLTDPYENKEYSKGFRSMRGNGIGYKSRKYITHTTLSPNLSAIKTFTKSQVFNIFFFLLLVIFSLWYFPLASARFFIAIISFLYLFDSLFNFYLIVKSLGKPTEISFSDKELSLLNDFELPIYSILCPLYKEAHVVPQFVNAIEKLDWPKEKLDVLLLLEEDDIETVDAMNKLNLPFYFRILIVPTSVPKTKPKACNYGLTYSKGEYLVIYDAEDVPDPLQLKKAYLAFKTLPTDIGCLQAKLNYYNSNQNLLTRLFTAEYSLWFDLTLTGLQSLNSTIPLGGTSNHFRTIDLHKLEGWDPFNVTEDADLGIRLFKLGKRTAIIDSTTLEEGNSNLHNWIRQRSRWIKGYFQTYLVHTRNIADFIKQNGLRHTIIFHLIIGGKLLFLLINPMMWLLTLTYFIFHPYSYKIIEDIYIAPISYIAVFSWIFGNFIFLYSYMIGLGKRAHWENIRYVLLMPFYWFLMSYAAILSTYQLIFRPHYWEKTIHGLHLNKNLNIGNVHLSRRISKDKLLLNKLIIENYILLIIYYLLFFTLDILLAKILFTNEIFNFYSITSVIGKIIFILSQFVGFIIYKLESKSFSNLKKNSKLNYALFPTFITGWMVLISIWINDKLLNFVNVHNLDANYLFSIYLFAVIIMSLLNIILIYNFNLGKLKFLFFSLAFMIIKFIAIFNLTTDIYSVIGFILFFSIFELLGYVVLGNFKIDIKRSVFSKLKIVSFNKNKIDFIEENLTI